MSKAPVGEVLAPLKFTGLVDSLCFKGLPDLFKYLQTNGFAVVPTNITNVQVGVDQPTSTQTSDVWFRLNSAGKFIGIYMYDGVTWQQVIYPPGGYEWVHGDSDNPPAGFRVLTGSITGWDPGEITFLEAQYYPAGPGPWTIFAVEYVGF